MTVDDTLLRHFRQSQATTRRAGRRLAGGGDDGQPPGMETDIALLKQRADQTDQRLERIEGKLDQVLDRIGQTATKATVWGALGTGAVLAFTVVGIFIAILTYLQDQRIAARPEAPAAPTPPAQVILNLPPWPSLPAPPSPPAPP